MSRPERGGLILVTGGAGFIGSHLVEALLERGYGVRVLDDLSTGHRTNLSGVEGRYEWLEGSAGEYEVCERAVAGVSAVMHQAAIPSVPRSMAEPLVSHRAGPLATLNVLEASRRAGVKRVIYASSSSVYGDTPTLPKVETMVPDPLSPYAVGKLSGEYYLRVYARSLGVDGAALRYFNVFGPRQDPSSPYSGVISLFARLMRGGEAPRICGDGHQSRDFTYVANVVQANIKALEHTEPLGGIALNVGTGRRVTIRELVGAMNRILGTTYEPSYGPARPGDVLHSLADLGLIARTLGYVPEVELEAGLRRTLAG